MIQVNRLSALLAGAAALVVALVPSSVFAAPGVSDSSRVGLVVTTDKGHVRGTVNGDVREFLGIPYAAPPVGDLRWQPAQPHARWQGVLDATRFGSPCPQVGGLFGPSSTNEDCLFLNVFTPAAADRDERLPVMFWIHGGALVSGAGSQYNPSDLVRQGVIVVTINYRLGELGFLAHPALAGSPGGPSGDYGLTDQQKAMSWVQRNIARFGGAAGNVTIFGESAGGLSVHSQLASPLAHGLFAKAITESGAYSMVQQSLTQAEAVGTQYASSVGCANQTAACLRSLSVATLLSKQPGIVNPDVDGRVLTQSIKPAFASGQFNRVPVIEGTNHDEWSLFVAVTELTTGHVLTPADYENAIRQTIFVPAAVAHTLATMFYPLSNYGGNASVALTALGTDAIFACNARTSIRSMSAFVPAFQYQFSDENAPSAFKASFPLGAYHASELQYLFTAFGGHLTAGQQRLSATMRSYWTEFAKHGNPNSEDTPLWPRYSATTERLESLVPPVPHAGGGFAAEHQCSLWG